MSARFYRPVLGSNCMPEGQGDSQKHLNRAESRSPELECKKGFNCLKGIQRQACNHSNSPLQRTAPGLQAPSCATPGSSFGHCNVLVIDMCSDIPLPGANFTRQRTSGTTGQWCGRFMQVNGSHKSGASSLTALILPCSPLLQPHEGGSFLGSLPFAASQPVKDCMLDHKMSAYHIPQMPSDLISNSGQLPSL